MSNLQTEKERKKQPARRGQGRLEKLVNELFCEQTNFEMVEEFMLAMEQNVAYQPFWPSDKVQHLRVDLIEEELGELKDAIWEDMEIVDVADALTDLLYVIYGAGHAFGIDLDECFKEVHKSNMSKLGEDGKPIHRKDGKVVKGPNFVVPDLEKVLFP